MTDASPPMLADIFPGDSALSRLMRGFDWSAHPLGDPALWPDALRVPVAMMLNSRFEIWLGWGPELHFLYNDAYAPTMGIRHPHMLGRPFREVWAEVYDDVAPQVATVRAGGATWDKALRLLLERSGFREETYHSFSYSPLRGPEGAIDGLLCIVTEETERVIGERRMGTLRALGQHLVGALARADVLAAVHSALDAERHDFPFSLLYLRTGDGAWQGHAISADAVPLLDRRWPFSGVESGGGVQRVVLPPELAPPSGGWADPPAEALIVPLARASGERPFGALVLGLNPYRPHDEAVAEIAQLLAGQISGALANAETFDTTQRRADRTWRNSRDLMVVIDAAGMFRSVNPAWTRILGHPAEDVVGRRVSDFIHPDDRADTEAALVRAVGQQDLTRFENRFLARDGTPRWLSWHTTLEDGLVYAYGRDVTEERAQADALAAAEDSLRQAQKMEAVGQLTGGIAHDFNNLLTGIIGSLEMMQRKAAQGKTADVARYVAAATTSANRAAALTQRLLAFSRRQSLDPKPVDAIALVRGMEELLRRSIGEEIALEIVAGGGLWRTRCDPNQLENAVLNLAINARDAMPDGGRLTIETGNVLIDARYAASNRAATPGQYVCISVTDTGCGMSPDIVAKAFDPFFTTKPIGQGTGLGLSMIYGFARQSEGFVDIYSEVDQGSTVKVYLPRHYGDGEERAAGAESHDPAATRTDGAERVLVVEDEVTVRSLIVEVLADLGYETIEAVDGPTGLERLRAAMPIDLLITDVGLPGLNGRQLADAARTFQPDLRVLFVTGYAHNAAVGNGLLEPGMEVITKPFAIDALARRVRTMIEG